MAHTHVSTSRCRILSRETSPLVVSRGVTRPSLPPTIRELAYLSGGRVRWGETPPIHGLDTVVHTLATGTTTPPGSLFVLTAERPEEAWSEAHRAYHEGAQVVVSRHRVIPWAGRCAIEVDTLPGAADRLTRTFLQQASARILIVAGEASRGTSRPWTSTATVLESLRNLLRACDVEMTPTVRWGSSETSSSGGSRRKSWLLLAADALPSSHGALDGIAELVVMTTPLSEERRFAAIPRWLLPRGGGCQVVPTDGCGQEATTELARTDVIRYGEGPRTHVGYRRTADGFVFGFCGGEWTLPEKDLSSSTCRRWAMLIATGLMVVPEPARLAAGLDCLWRLERFGERSWRAAG